jgi:hypothetical protein
MPGGRSPVPNKSWFSRAIHPSRRHLEQPLVDIDHGKVRFRGKDYRNGSRQKTMRPAAEFIRGFLLPFC